MHGEHSVVYGKLAIAASLGLRTAISLEETNDNANYLEFNFDALNLKQTFRLEDVQKHLVNDETEYTDPDLINYAAVVAKIECFLAKYDVRNINQKQALLAALFLLSIILNKNEFRGFSVNVKTELTVSAGCGSSASFATALAGAFLRYRYLKATSRNLKTVQKEFTSEQLSYISKSAYLAEKIIHGTPSGLDNTICVYGSFVVFRKGSDFDKINVAKSLKVLLINTKVSRNTKALVGNVAKLRERHLKVVDCIFDAMENVAQEALLCLKEFEKVSDEKDKNEALYKQLWVSNNIIKISISNASNAIWW